MIISNNRTYRGFITCRGTGTKDEIVTIVNKAGPTNNKFFYTVGGSGKASVGDHVIPLEEGLLADLSEYTDQEITYTSYTATFTWMAFNPIKTSSNLQVMILKEGTHVISDEHLDTILVPITKPITVNNITVPTSDSVRIPKGKVMPIILLEGAVCAMVRVIPM